MSQSFRLVFIAIATCFSLILSSEPETHEAQFRAMKGPIFKNYGPVFKIENTDTPLVQDTKYKVFFDVAEASKKTTSLNRRIESVARYINMHAMNGVKLEDMDIAVVLHGSATRDALNSKAYDKQYLSSNPTLDLIEQLHSRGVKFYQCGQSLYFKQHTKSDLAPQVQLALSAMTASTQLQSDGYTLIP